MHIVAKKILLSHHKTAVLIVSCFENTLGSQLKELDEKLGNTIATSLKAKRFTGEKKQTITIPTQGKIGAEYLVVIGLGKKKTYTLEVLRQAAGVAAKAAKGLQAKEFSTTLFQLVPKGRSAAETVQAVTEGSLLALYSFNEYKTEEKDKTVAVKKITFIYTSTKEKDTILTASRIGQKIADAVCFSRNLVTHPGNTATPTFLANTAKKIAKDHSLTCKVFGLDKIKQLKMGAFHSVCKGTHEPPKFIILEYFGGKKKQAPVVFVGKGVTFDSGGISLKPSHGMEEMKFDMAGGAAVLGAAMAAASLQLPVNLVCLVPATENLPGGSASKPGDIFKSMSGKTVEVISTDAEGRLLLADTLTYAKRYKPEVVIDVATLTGACIVALGYAATAILGNDAKLIEKIKAAGEETGERIWELPLWEEYDHLIKSDAADIKNSGGRGAGTITAAAFLKKFADSMKWAHLDIAGTAWCEKETPYIPKGASGVGVRLLVQYLIDKTTK